MSQARDLDQFYTNKNIAKMCIEAVISETKFVKGKKVYIEPSAGAGAFYEQLPPSKLGFDLDPKCEGVIQSDFFEVDVSKYVQKNQKVITIGNPPFGKNSSLALKFVNRAALFSRIVAFILPRTFLKNSVSNRVDPFLHKIFEMELPKNSFNFEGEIYDVPCVFQIWEKRDYERIKSVSSLTSPDFDFVEPKSADFAIRRVGVLAGKVIVNFSGYAQASHYFIKSKIDKNRLINRLNGIDYSGIKNNTAGNPSISKRELIELYSKMP